MGCSLGLSVLSSRLMTRVVDSLVNPVEIWLMGTACQLLTIVPGGLGGLKWNLIDPLNIIKGGSRKGSEDLLIQCLLDAFTYGHKELGCSLVSELCPSWDSWESHVSSTKCEHLDRSIQDVNSTVC